MTTKKISKAIAKRGRPRGFELESALETAMDLFHRRGYDGVGIAELSKAIGVSAPSLYAAFGNKRSLFAKVLQCYVQAHGGWLPTALASEDTLEATMLSVFTQAAETYAANAEKPGCLIIDGTRNCTDAEAQQVTAGYRQATAQLIRDRILLTPALTAAAADSLANYAVTILVGLSGSARDGMDIDTLRTTAKIAAEGFAQALRDYLNAAPEQ